MAQFERGSVEDLVARGVSRERILEETGVDVGNCGIRYRDALKGVNRAEYQKEYVMEMDDAEFIDLLNQWADDVISRTDFYVECGVKESCRWTIRALSEFKGLLDAYQAAERRHRQRAAERGFDTIERKYGPGIRHNMQIPGAVERAKQTCEKRYGTRNVMTLPEIQAKHRATCQAHWGCDYPTQAQAVKDKTKVTNQRVYHCDNPMQHPDIKKRQQQGVRDSLGVDNPMHSQAVKDKVKATTLAVYGVPCSLQAPEVLAKADVTCLARYGQPLRQVMRSPVVLAKRQATCQMRFNGPSPFSSAAVREAWVDTNRKKYGADYFVQTDAFQAKSCETLFCKYGVYRACDIHGIREQIAATTLSRLGVENPMQSADVVRQRSEDLFRRTGYHWPMQNPVVKAKMRATKKKNGTFGKSKAEDALYDKLVAKFGVDDVVRQYNCELYPYDCDFYIKSRDMYVELNGFGTHGGHWFGSWEYDTFLYMQAVANGMSVCSMNDDTWTRRDVMKREDARRNNLNYIVFWGEQGEDSDLWFAFGCPDGHDWEREYSWLPERDLYYDGSWPVKLTTGPLIVSAAVRMANWRIFYESEIAFWNSRFDSKWGTIQARLYTNRLKYLDKDVTTLSNRDVLRGLTISGMYHGYSPYNNSGMVAFLETYKPVSVYDPCAGWGERMLTCAAMGIQYLGVDINKRLMPGYRRMMKQYNLSNVGIIYGDSSRVDLSHGHQDCVFTCPPYEGLEIYSDMGAENLSHDDFIKWWQAVVSHSVGPDTKVFAYQVNQSCKQAMNQVLLDAGWHLDSVISVNKDKVSHLVRSKGDGKKKDFEEIQVFVR